MSPRALKITNYTKSHLKKKKSLTVCTFYKACAQIDNENMSIR